MLLKQVFRQIVVWVSHWVRENSTSIGTACHVETGIFGRSSGTGGFVDAEGIVLDLLVVANGSRDPLVGKTLGILLVHVLDMGHCLCFREFFRLFIEIRG